MAIHPGPTLTVSLHALRENYELLRTKFSGKECAAVVKANAYGLGVEAVSKALHADGCRTFFVATLEEGLQLRGLMPSARIAVFHGPYAGEEMEYIQHRLIPVINSMEQFLRWHGNAPFALHVDTGMSRLGLTQQELEANVIRLNTPNLQMLISHLACASETAHEKNLEQRERFRAARALLPKVPASLCNSSGIFLGQDYHFDLARPGCSLYGINPGMGPNPMRPVVKLTAPILQIRECDREETVGYGATAKVPKGARLAIMQLGYSDGFFRLLGDKKVKSKAYIGGHTVPVTGRISMDMLALDVSKVPAAALAPGAMAEFINSQTTVDDIAEAVHTIGYEVLTRLGRRVRRVYTP